MHDAEHKLVKSSGVGLHKWRRKNARIKIELVEEDSGKDEPGCLEVQSRDMPASFWS